MCSSYIFEQRLIPYNGRITVELTHKHGWKLITLAYIRGMYSPAGHIIIIEIVSN